ncbi:hypothetical protein B0H14DRAFT_3857790 [Mycena olivaceomarginata]|nr:hypothetical protein B0H14DRAFT_3857790 [Mycena olivaceomarginata]
MDAKSPLDDAAIVYDQRLNRYFQLAGIVLLVYDNLLTLDSEVQYIWKSWRSRASAWYLFIRYSSVCFRTVVLFTFDFGNFDLETYDVICLANVGNILMFHFGGVLTAGSLAIVAMSCLHLLFKIAAPILTECRSNTFRVLDACPKQY